MSNCYRTDRTTVQEKSDTLRNFLDRFDALAVRLSASVAATCREVGISRSLFYELRDGRRPLTAKMEQRLTEAERRAGIGRSPPAAYAPDGGPAAEGSPRVREDPAEEPGGMAQLLAIMTDLRAGVDDLRGMRREMERLQQQVAEL